MESSSADSLRKSFYINSFEMDQQNAIRLQQIEAIKLIQVSLDKLTCTNSVQLKSHSGPKSNTVLVYKETNLHKNLLVNKILNKAKYMYYQGVVQTMRLSLMSKLNYYTSLIHQLNGANSASAEASLVDEMKVLMQQILHETYQFNLTNQPNPLDLSVLFGGGDGGEPDQKRAKHLNELKVSLYSFVCGGQSPADKSKPSAKRTSQDAIDDDDEDENLSVDDDMDERMCKKCKISDESGPSAQPDTLDLNNNQILNDETNSKQINRRNLNKKFKIKSKSSTSASKILNIECLV